MRRSFPLWLWNEHLARYLFAANFVANKIVVDCACGAGIGSNIFLKKGAAHLIGFDLSQEAIDIAMGNNKDVSNGDFYVANSNSLPLEKDYAEVFISLETIEHIQEDSLFLKEVSRVMKSKGVFICSTPNRTVTNPGTNLGHKPWNSFHVREYSQAEFLSLMHEEFEEVEMYGLNGISLSVLTFENKLRKIFFINGYVWTNMKKFLKIFWDDIDNYKIEKVAADYEYEYLIAVCSKK